MQEQEDERHDALVHKQVRARISKTSMTTADNQYCMHVWHNIMQNSQYDQILYLEKNENLEYTETQLAR